MWKKPRAHLYVLCDPRTGEVRYVGATMDPRHRWFGHVSACRRLAGSPIANEWFAELNAAGIAPMLIVVNDRVSGDVSRAEARLARRCRKAGCRLINSTNSTAYPRKSLDKAVDFYNRHGRRRQSNCGVPMRKVAIKFRCAERARLLRHPATPATCIEFHLHAAQPESSASSVELNAAQPTGSVLAARTGESGNHCTLAQSK